MTPLLSHLWSRFRAYVPRGGFQFLFVGLTGLITDIAVLWVLEQAGTPKTVARAISISTATVATWVLNRKMTFDASGWRTHVELLRYCGVTLVVQTINYFIFLGALAIAPWMPHTVAVCIGSGIAAVLTYLGHRFFTFRKSETSRG